MNREQLIMFLEHNVLPNADSGTTVIRKDVQSELLLQLKSIPTLKARANHLDGLNAELSLEVVELKDGMRKLAEIQEEIDDMRCDTESKHSYQSITLAQESFDQILDNLVPMEKS